MQISTLSRNAALDGIAALINAGTAAVIEIRTGSAPTNTTDADSGTLLATLTMSASAFTGAAASGVLTADTITGDSSIDATNTAAHFRIKTQAGGTVIIQGSVGTSGKDINFNSVSFVSGGTCNISSLTITCPAGAPL